MWIQTYFNTGENTEMMSCERYREEMKFKGVMRRGGGIRGGGGEEGRRGREDMRSRRIEKKEEED